MWDKIREVFSVAAFVAAGLTLLFMSMLLFMMPGLPLWKHHLSGFFRIPILILISALFIGVVLRGFRNWQLCCGSVFLTISGIQFFGIFTFVCAYYTPSMRVTLFADPNFNRIYAHPGMGIGFWVGMTILGLLLVRSAAQEE